MKMCKKGRKQVDFDLLQSKYIVKSLDGKFIKKNISS